MAVRYLITGGAGFLGSHLTESLLARGDHVTVLDDLSTGRLANLSGLAEHPSLDFIAGSVLDELIVDELVHQCDVVVHLAAAVGVKLIIERPLRSFTTNVRGSEIVVGAAHRYRRRLLVASTSEIYGKNGTAELTEEADRILGPTTTSRWMYSTAKAVDEILALTYHRERGLPATAVRLFNTVGPHQSPHYGMVVPRLARQAVGNVPLTVYGDGQQSRCFCHVHDVVEAMIGILDEPRTIGEIYNVGSTEETTILELARRIIDLARSSSSVDLVPYSEAYGEGFEDMQRRVPSTAKLHAVTGWAPTRTLEAILQESIAEARSELVSSPSP